MGERNGVDARSKFWRNGNIVLFTVISKCSSFLNTRLNFFRASRWLTIPFGSSFTSSWIIIYINVTAIISQDGQTMRILDSSRFEDNHRVRRVRNLTVWLPKYTVDSAFSGMFLKDVTLPSCFSLLFFGGIANLNREHWSTCNFSARD